MYAGNTVGKRVASADQARSYERGIMLRNRELTDRELLLFSIIISFGLFYVVALILLLTVLNVGGWDVAAADFIALTGPALMSQLLYRWTIS